jgi:hypothetical protein
MLYTILPSHYFATEPLAQREPAGATGYHTGYQTKGYIPVATPAMRGLPRNASRP